jgi:DNA helicase IV
MLHRPRAPRLDAVPWTEADLALVDEADELLGPVQSALPAKPRRRGPTRGELDAADSVVRELGLEGQVNAADMVERFGGSTLDGDGSGEPRTYGHVLVDEAQDLTPMQWRMISRRVPSGSMTIVGDIGQASRPGSAESWDEVVAAIGSRLPARSATLTVNYRTPAEIMEVAHRVLAVASPELEPTEAVRHTGVQPRFDRVEEADIVSAAARSARRGYMAQGTVAVVAAVELHAPIVAALADLGAVGDSDAAIEARVAVLSAQDTKGLEFDHVVVVEPATLVPTEDRAGLRLLYVTLTRATRTLTVLHAQPLPEALHP